MKKTILDGRHKHNHICDQGIEYMLIFSMFFLSVLVLNFSIRDYHFEILILSSLGLIFFLLLFLAVKNGVETFIIRAIFVVTLNFIVFPIGWILSFGTNVPMIFYTSNFLLMSSIQIRKKIEYSLSILLIVEIILLWHYQDSLILWVNSFLQRSSNSIPMIVHFAISAMMTLLIATLNWINFERIKEKLNTFYLYDELTGLYSRRYINSIITELLNSQKGSNEPFSLFVIDIDNFKKVNDLYGHHIGDEVLIKLGSIIQQNIKTNGIGARYGGDEFMLIIKDDIEANTFILIDKITTQFNQYASQFKDIDLNLSYGQASRSFETLNDLVQSADKLLYDMKMYKKSQNSRVRKKRIQKN